MEKILVTGSCGFIGMHLCKSLLNDGFQVFGIDNMNDYYDVSLKEGRLNELSKYKNFQFSKSNISIQSDLESIFKKFNPNKVINLAAQAGVRYSLENPHSYIENNVMGFMNILECCRNYKTEGLIYASSSSVYGGNEKIPFSVKDNVNDPISIYAVSKRSNELMAKAYYNLYGLHSTGLRFFTVYGPWGRPDMAMYIFARKISKSEPITVFNNGKMFRDFTYIDDIIQGVRKSINYNYPFELFNLGNNSSEDIMDMITIIEKCLGKKAEIEYLGMQKGDVKKTFADISHARDLLGYNPKTKISLGIKIFIEWFKSFKNIS